MLIGKMASGKDNINGTIIKNSLISPCCKVELHFKIWNNVIRVIENGFYPCKCSKCHHQYYILAPKEHR